MRRVEPSNPRVAAWLRACNRTPNDIAPDEHGDTRRLPIPGLASTVPWPVLFTHWNAAQLDAWGRSLGWRGRPGEPFDIRLCFAFGKHPLDYDAWLRDRFPGP